MPHRCRVWSPPKSAFVSGRGRDRRWQICLTTNVHLSAYWRALSQWWFMLKIPRTLPLPSPPTLSFQHLPRSALHTETKSGPVISSFHAVRFAKKTVDLSLVRIWEHHLFSFTLPSLSQRKIILYIYEWPCLPVYGELLFKCITAEANSSCQTTKITYFQTLNLTSMTWIYWAVCFWYPSFSFLFLLSESLSLSVHLSESTQA